VYTLRYVYYILRNACVYAAQHMLYAAQCIQARTLYAARYMPTRTLYVARYNYITRDDGQPSVHIGLHVYRRQYHLRYCW
jgi:hypothetical protein